jgi:hypothetical protein
LQIIDFQENSQYSIYFCWKWIDCFKEAIKTHEKDDFDMHGKIARVNEQVKHKDGNWFNATSMW